ncbi:MAG: hypothetical protein ABIZ95_13875 [Pyrinomonadaceae bacterium]
MISTLRLVFMILLCASATFGCSMAGAPPAKDEAVMYRGRMLRPISMPSAYAFTGEVVAIITMERPAGAITWPTAEAVRVRVDEEIYLNGISFGGGIGAGPRSYDVLPLAIYPDCSLHGQSGMAQAFPVGTKVRVIASDAVVYRRVGASGFAAGGAEVAQVRLLAGGDAIAIKRLEVSLSNGGRISRNDLALGLETDARSVYDYRNFSTKKPPTREGQTVIYSKQEFLAFELQKDLARLHQSRTETERLAVLERLVYYPYATQLAFHRLIAGYLPVGAKRAELERLWDERKRLPVEVGPQI